MPAPSAALMVSASTSSRSDPRPLATAHVSVVGNVLASTSKGSPCCFNYCSLPSARSRLLTEQAVDALGSTAAKYRRLSPAGRDLYSR